MQSRKYVLGLVVAIALGGCAHPVCHPVTSPDLRAKAHKGIDPPIDTTQAYPSWRFIGIKADANAQCPQISGWKERPLFEFGARRGQCSAASDPREIEAVAEELDRFCLYEATHACGVPRQVSGLARIDPDAVALVSSGQGELGERVWQPLYNHFLQQVGRAEPEFSTRGDELVRLAFLDSEPTAAPAGERKGRMEHGHFLSLVGRELTRAKNGPTALVTTQLALPIVDFHPGDPKKSRRDSEAGGWIGSFADLADAIRKEVEAWQIAKRERHLVINLSLGWDGRSFGGLETRVYDMPAGPQAVYQALEYAAAHGALIVAAAGNFTPGPDPTTGPLLPAAWERASFERSQCGGERKQSPLLYAVGGVRSDGRPIANARPGGMPGLAAYADHAVLPDASQPTSTYTGTSVATAVVASTAAVVWHFLPDLDAGQVIDRLRASGDPLDYPADFSSFAHDPIVRRVSLCTALRSVSGELGEARPWGDLRCNWDREPPALSALLDQAQDPGPRTSMVPPLMPCRADRVFFDPPIPDLGTIELCPARTRRGRFAQAWVKPQPGIDLCPDCPAASRPAVVVANARSITVAAPVTLNIEINPDWDFKKFGTPVSATLEVQGPNGTTGYYIPFEEGRPPRVVSLPGEIAMDGTTTATISWLVKLKEGLFKKKLYSVRTPILIAR